MAGGVETGRWEEVILEIPEGLHNRPSNSFSRCAARFGGKVLVRKGSEEANGASILGLLMFAADNGEKLQLWIERKPEWEKTKSDLIAILKGDQGVTNYWSNR
jgi:phosphotransferase system HPr (HPr) family protein